MKILRHASLITVMFLVACNATQGPVRQVKPAGGDPIADYRRSRPEAPPPKPFDDFAAFDGQTLYVVKNPTLLDQQAWVICENRSAQKSSTLPISKADQDCYRTPANSSDIGQLRVVAVPSGSTKEIAARAGRVLSTIDLTGKNHVAVNLAGLTKPGECLALVDTGGTTLSVRQTDRGGDHLFATSAMRVEAQRARLRASFETYSKVITDAEGDARWYISKASQSPAWRSNNTCVAPAMAEAPPRPRNLPSEVIGDYARANCALVLANKIGERDLMNAVNSMQAYEYQAAWRTRGTDPIKYERCVHGAYEYPQRDVSLLSGEIIQHTAGEDAKKGYGPMSIITAILQSAPEQISLTAEKKNSMIVSLLKTCTIESIKACNVADVAHQDQIRRIKEGPQIIRQECQTALDGAAKQRQKAAEAEQETKAIAARITALDALDTSGKILLSEAVCSP